MSLHVGLYSIVQPMSLYANELMTYQLLTTLVALQHNVAWTECFGTHIQYTYTKIFSDNFVLLKVQHLPFSVVYSKMKSLYTFCIKQKMII